MENLLSELNQEQKLAVEYIDGPQLIIAGAGSGKTRVLTYKIAYLLQHGYSSHSILALTFTNKAAREMKERIVKVLGDNSARGIWMGTFHSIFLRILRQNAELIGFPSNFTIYDTSDSRSLIRSIIKEMQLDDKIYSPNTVHAIISKAKNNLYTPNTYAQDKDYTATDKYNKRPLMAQVYKNYFERCKRAGAMDFDDLLLYTNILFRDFPDVLHHYQQQFSYILVDEYQDTNFSQHLIVSQLAKNHSRLCVVGDDAQSIYSFRGAQIGNILNLNKEFPQCKTYKLQQNYRSTQMIVNAANSLIKNNVNQIHKDVFSKNEVGTPISVIKSYSDFEEGYTIANLIAQAAFKNKGQYNDFAILYRTNAQSRIFEEALRKRNIPYRVYGSLSFYQRKEIKDVVAYMRLAINPNDEEAFKRVINYPTRGIGATTIQKVTACATIHQVSLFQITESPLQYSLDVNASTANKLTTFAEMIRRFSNSISTENAYETAEQIIKESGIARDINTDDLPENQSKRENIDELLNGIQTFCQNKLEEGSEASLSNFLSEISLATDQDQGDDENRNNVTLMTIHASKGLEFKQLFITGLEEELFPAAMSVQNSHELEEERRLFYVALTRAEEQCTLSYATSRFRHGKTNSTRPSRFITDIDTKYLYYPDQDYFPTRETRTTPKVTETFVTKQHTRTTVETAEQPSKWRKITSSEVTDQSSGTAPDHSFVVGCTVKHDRFGRGQVIETEGVADNAKVTIRFETMGEKKLLLKFAKLTLIK